MKLAHSTHAGSGSVSRVSKPETVKGLRKLTFQHRESVVNKKSETTDNNSGNNSFIGTNLKAQKVIEELDAFNRTLSKTKLNGNDIQLILYLIVQIKPFKYVGDRSVSQTYKWELVQRKYVEIKTKEYQRQTKVVAPTVRTLQRQLASAIKRASVRMKNKENSIDNITQVLCQITRDTSVEELENATFQLNIFSENLKAGREVPVESLVSSEEFEIVSELVFSLPRLSLMSSLTSQDKIVPTFHESKRLLETTRNQVESALKAEDPKSLKSLLKTIERLTSECEQTSLTENERIMKQTRLFVEQKLEECTKTIELSMRELVEQQQKNKALMERVIAHIGLE